MSPNGRHANPYARDTYIVRMHTQHECMCPHKGRWVKVCARTTPGRSLAPSSMVYVLVGARSHMWVMVGGSAAPVAPTMWDRAAQRTSTRTCTHMFYSVRATPTQVPTCRCV